jgi:membrane protein
VTNDVGPQPGTPGLARWRGRAELLQRRLDDSILGLSWRRAAELNLVTHSLALAAQQVLCTAPLLVAFSLAKRHSASQNIGNVLAHYLALTPAASQDVGTLFNNTHNVSTGDRVSGLILALLFSTAIAATQQRWFELVWSQSRASALRSTLRQLLWVASLCGYLVLILYAGRAGHGVGRRVHAGRPAGPVVQFGVSFLFFWWSQHLLLGGRIGWRQLIPGATTMALGMSILVGLSGFAMSSQIVSEVSDYGLIGSTFVLSLWLVALSGLLCGGALFGRQLMRPRSG